MNAPAQVPPSYKHTPLFPLGEDKAPYRKLTSEGVRLERMGGRELVVVEREALRALAEAAFSDINHLLRPGHLKQLRAILDDPQASDNDKFVAYDFLKNANIAAGGVLPMCQDTGTAIIMGKKGRFVFTDGDDEAALAEARARRLPQAQPALFAAAPISMFEERNTKSNMPAQVEIYAEGQGRTTAPTSSYSSPRAAVPPTSRSCSRRRPRSSPTTALSPSSRKRCSRWVPRRARPTISPSSSAAPRPSSR